MDPVFQQRYLAYSNLASSDYDFFLELNDAEIELCKKIAAYISEKKPLPDDINSAIDSLNKKAVLFKEMKAKNGKVIQTKNSILSFIKSTINKTANATYLLFHPEQTVPGGFFQSPPTQYAGKFMDELLVPILVDGADFDTSAVSGSMSKICHSDEVWRSIAKRIGCPEIIAPKGEFQKKVKEYCIEIRNLINNLPDVPPDIKALTKGRFTVEKMRRLGEWKLKRDEDLIKNKLCLMLNLTGFTGTLAELCRIFEPELKGITTVDLSDMHLTSLPKEICQFTWLTSLYLVKNDILYLPSQISNLRSLETLVLKHNWLKVLPPEIGSLTSLENLMLEDNQLEELPKEIVSLTKLNELSLQHNHLTKLPPEIGSLRALERLYLSANRLTSVPKELALLDKMTNLMIDYNPLETVPEEITKLRKLETLDLTRTQISELPTEIGNLQELTYLALSGNKLTVLPTEIEQLGNLRYLYLAGNPLSSLPAGLSHLDVIIYVLETPQLTLSPEFDEMKANHMITWEDHYSIYLTERT